MCISHTRTLVKTCGCEVHVLPQACKRWQCEECAPKLRARVAASIAAGAPTRVALLTCRQGQFESPSTAARALKSAFTIIRRRWRKLHPGAEFEFLVIVEQHKSGWPHFHIAIRAHWLDKKWLSKQTAELLNSPITYVQPVRSVRGVARYLCKYLVKGLTKFAGCKRYWRSKRWCDAASLKIKSDFDWSGAKIEDEGHTSIVHRYLKRGYAILRTHGEHYTLAPRWSQKIKTPLGWLSQWHARAPPDFELVVSCRQ